MYTSGGKFVVAHEADGKREIRCAGSVPVIDFTEGIPYILQGTPYIYLK